MIAVTRLLSFSRSPGAAGESEGLATSIGLGVDDAQALFGFARRLGLNDAQADDVVQESQTRLLTEVRRGIIIANPRAWSFRTTYRLVMDEYRFRRRIALLSSRLAMRRREPESEPSDRVAVWSEVDRLPERQRQVIYLRYRADLAYEEIGQTLGITAGAARSHAATALERLRAELAGSIEDMP